MYLGYFRLYRIILSQYPYLFGTVDYMPAQRADSLIAHKEYGALTPGYICHQVVLYPAPGTHPGAGYYHGYPRYIINLL